MALQATPGREVTLFTLPRLIVISDLGRGSHERWFAELTALLELARPGSVLVLLRDRELPIRVRRAFGEQLRGLTRAHAQALSVSDRLDLAVLLEADAVHLAGDSVSVGDARCFGARVGYSFWISCAAHSPNELATSCADALLLSPVVAARKGRPALGSDGLLQAIRARARRSGEQPPGLYALGGVTHREAGELCAAGAEGVAVMGELFEPGSARRLIAALDIAR